MLRWTKSSPGGRSTIWFGGNATVGAADPQVFRRLLPRQTSEKPGVASAHSRRPLRVLLEELGERGDGRLRLGPVDRLYAVSLKSSSFSRRARLFRYLAIVEHQLARIRCPHFPAYRFCAVEKPLKPVSMMDALMPFVPRGLHLRIDHHRMSVRTIGDPHLAAVPSQLIDAQIGVRYRGCSCMERRCSSWQGDRFPG